MAPALVAVDKVMVLPPVRRGFVTIDANKGGVHAMAGRRWVWSSSRLAIGVTGGSDWRGSWDLGAGLRYEW